MFPHNFVVKEIEFWSGYNWGTIKLESSQARNVLLEHAKYHPFKPFTDGKSQLTLFLVKLLSIHKTQKLAIFTIFVFVNNVQLKYMFDL